MLIVQNIAVGYRRENKKDKDNRTVVGEERDKNDNELAPNELIKWTGKSEALVDIQLTVYEAEEKIFINLVYCTELFKEDTMKRFLSHLIEIISIVSADKEIKIADINISHDFGKAQSNIILGEKTDFVF
jgi:ribulose 1,5-bisphosphate carboxylase large subunit-like protein